MTFRPLARNRAWSGPLRGTAEQRGYGPAWRKLRLIILERDRRLCQPCLRRGIVTLGRIVDHIIPKAEGGTDDQSNLETVCPACDKVKTAAEAKRGQSRRR